MALCFRNRKRRSIAARLYKARTVALLSRENIQSCRGLACPLERLSAALPRIAAALRTLAVAVSVLATFAVAAEPPTATPAGLVVSSALERIVPAVDGEVVVDVTPGTLASHADQLIYSVRFTNAGDELLDGIRITSKVPADVKYVPESAVGPGSEVLYSVDNGRTFGRPAELKVVGAEGVERRADAAEYTHVRWVLDAPLDAGASGIARFRAVPR